MTANPGNAVLSRRNRVQLVAMGRDFKPPPPPCRMAADSRHEDRISSYCHAGLDPGIHASKSHARRPARWIAGSSPAMTGRGGAFHQRFQMPSFFGNRICATLASTMWAVNDSITLAGDHVAQLPARRLCHCPRRIPGRRSGRDGRRLQPPHAEGRKHPKSYRPRQPAYRTPPTPPMARRPAGASGRPTSIRRSPASVSTPDAGDRGAAHRRHREADHQPDALEAAGASASSAGTRTSASAAARAYRQPALSYVQTASPSIPIASPTAPCASSPAAIGWASFARRRRPRHGPFR